MTRVLIQDLSKHFAGAGPRVSTHRRGAVDGLDLEIGQDEFFVLLGPSGCGKTTTLRCIAGLEEPSGGTITIGQQRVVDVDQAIFVPPHRRQVGMMFQSYALWPHMSVLRNIAYPLEHLRPRPDRRSIEDRVARTLEIVGLEGFESRRPTELSGGQQQRVALARTIATRPRLRLFDEPLSNLDAQLRMRLRQDLRRVHEESGGSSIYVTHDQAEALALADRIAIMNAGRLEQLGTPHEIFRSPVSRFVAEFLGYENILSGIVERVSGNDISFRPDGWSVAITGRASLPAVAGDRGFAAVRGAAVRLQPRPSQGSFGEAILRSVSYQGDSYAAIVRLGDTVLQGVIPLDAIGSSPQQGQALFAEADAFSVVILPEDPGADPVGVIPPNRANAT